VAAGEPDGKTLDIYINGVKDRSVAATGNLAASAEPVRMGTVSINNRPYGGMLDDVRIYNRALSASEVVKLHDLEKLGATVDYSIVFTEHPADSNATTGSNITLTANATALSPVGYQWQKNGADLNGSSSSSLVITNAKAVDSGTYRVIASNEAGSKSSNPATVNIGDAPAITVHPADTIGAIDSNASFTFEANGTGPLTYQWQKEGVDLNGSNASVLLISNLSTEDNGTYRVIVTNPFGMATSNGAGLTIGASPVFTRQPVDTNATTGGNVTLSSTAIGTGAIAYQWQKNSVDLNGSNSPNLIFTNISAKNNIFVSRL